MFEIAMIVLIRLRMNDDRKVDTRFVHALQKMFGCRWLFRRVRRSSMIRKSGIILPGKAMKVRIDARRARRLCFRAIEFA
jgi:hypothetical protein